MGKTLAQATKQQLNGEETLAAVLVSGRLTMTIKQGQKQGSISNYMRWEYTRIMQDDASSCVSVDGTEEVYFESLSGWLLERITNTVKPRGAQIRNKQHCVDIARTTK